MGSYREHLRVPVSYWLLAIPVVALLGGELYAGFSGYIPPLIYAVFTAAVVAFLLSWGAASIEVSNGVLRAGRATLPLDQIGDVVALDEKQSALIRGPRADPTARLLLRPWLKRAVYIEVTGPGEAPYWLVGTRRPEQLASAIQRSRETVG
ncbi:MAG TPA: DUF3093 domain-containing protein [Trebonia sp.]